VGWEVARKVGGIYTVLRTKAPVSVQTYGDRYYLIGPYAPGVTTLEFEELEAEGVCRAAVLALRSSGIGVHFGRWCVA
jgi:glycogen(starch) synthase